MNESSPAPRRPSRETLKGIAWILAVVGLWFVLQRWVLPAAGCGT